MTRLQGLRYVWLTFLLLFLFSSLLGAKTLHARYRVEYGIVGKVADVNVTLTQNGKHYEIEAYVSAHGTLANFVTKHLREHHLSKGYVRHGRYVTDTYAMYKRYDVFRSETLYTRKGKFNRVIKQYKKWKKNRLIIRQKYRLNYRASEDLLSFFLNLPKTVLTHPKQKKFHLRVIGADRKAGLVTCIIPSVKAYPKYEKLVGKLREGEWYAKVIMYRKLYGSKQGELELRLDRQGIVRYAVLEDLVFFGDVRIILEKLW